MGAWWAGKWNAVASNPARLVVQPKVTGKQDSDMDFFFLLGFIYSQGGCFPSFEQHSYITNNIYDHIALNANMF